VLAKASIATIGLPLDAEIWSHRGSFSNGKHMLAHQAAQDTTAGWMLVWINQRASRAILLPAMAYHASETAAQAAKARALSIADRLRVLMEELKELNERDPGSLGGRHDPSDRCHAVVPRTIIRE
jgi:hypothetical protein